MNKNIEKIHTKWLSKAKTAVINGSEMTVLPYGYLSQAVEEALNTHTQELREKIKNRISYPNDHLVHAEFCAKRDKKYKECAMCLVDDVLALLITEEKI